MEELQQTQLASKEKALRAQVVYTAEMMYHGASGNFIDCQAAVFPQLFDDSKLTKNWNIRRTKASYFATHGLYPYFHAKTVQAMKNRPFSLNFDESTVNGDSQLDINVSYLDEDLLVKKRMFTTTALERGTTGEEIADQVLNVLRAEGVDPRMCMSVSTDGCGAMLGAFLGAQKHLRDQIPTLPSWGGCADHDLANLLKSSVGVLCPGLTSIYSALHGCLSKHSMHKKRDFERLEEWVGLEIKKIPQFLGVRFRVIERCASWMESQDRGLYSYFADLKTKVLETSYQASDTEMIVLEKFLGNYLEVRLCNRFLLEVGKPVMELISYFESQKIRVQDRHSKLVLLLHSFLSKFMKNAGVENNETATGVILLKADYRNRTKQLEDKQLFVGGKVESLLAELGLLKESPEIKNWLLKVRGFYEEAVFKIIKYFSKSIKSKTLRSLAVLAPTSWSGMELDDLKKCWRVLGQQFSNVIQVSELPDLMVDVAALKVQGSTGDPDKMEVDEFFSNLSKVTDDEGNLVFPLLSKLGSALATLYNSSSMAERDFSLMNAIVADKSRTSQLLLLAKMYIKAEIMGLARSCKQCKVLSSVDEDGRHCHCHLWQPTDELMDTMRGGQPYRRYKADMEKRKQEEEDKQVLKDLNAQEDERKRLLDLKEEVEKMRKRVERQDKEDAEKKKNEAAKKATEASEKKKGNKKRKSSKAEEKRSEQGKKLKVT